MIIDAPTPAQLPQLRELWKEAFGDTEDFLNAFFATAFDPRRCLCVLLEGTVAAALYWFDCTVLGQKVAYLYAVATAKAHRGKGLARGLMDYTHRYLKGQGYAMAVLVPGQESLFRFYSAMGYRSCSPVRSFACGPAEMELTLQPIDGAEYARLRRSLLPQGGVVQEGENIAFLQAQAALYAGPGLLLAARREGAVLHGVELLPDASAAPGIVAALDCETGFFRTPGQGEDFAMYYPLDSGAAAPAYFGLAFD
ncbi:MAG: GNAT family N-acetyltransferase [Oscillospiraceae bacterium]|nr:GNAT family N-acetyltransferase [Oscillospiraceae bacterium]